MHTPESYDERKLLELLARGSEHAFTRIFDRYRPRIYSTALRFLKSPDLAEEVVQDVFLKVWLRREEFTRIVNFQGYLFTMVRNHIFDRLKDIAKEIDAKKQFAYGADDVTDTHSPLVEEQYEDLLNRVVNQLPPQQKRIFRLAKMEGLSHQAIAEQLHISRLTVKTHMAKALQRIRHSLKEHISSVVYLTVVLEVISDRFS